MSGLSLDMKEDGVPSSKIYVVTQSQPVLPRQKTVRLAPLSFVFLSSPRRDAQLPEALFAQMNPDSSRTRVNSSCACQSVLSMPNFHAGGCVPRRRCWFPPGDNKVRVWAGCGVSSIAGKQKPSAPERGHTTAVEATALRLHQLGDLVLDLHKQYPASATTRTIASGNATNLRPSPGGAMPGVRMEGRDDIRKGTHLHIF